MTGPEPGDLAEITWTDESGFEQTDTCIWDAGWERWSVLGVGDAYYFAEVYIGDEQVRAVRPLSVVPTDSLETRDEANRVRGFEQGLRDAADEAGAWGYLTIARELRRKAERVAAAAVRSAITTKEETK